MGKPACQRAGKKRIIDGILVLKCYKCNCVYLFTFGIDMKKIYCIPIFFFLCFLVEAQNHSIFDVRQFQKIQIDQYSNLQFVNVLEEDNQGFLWLGGTSGLKRFDGDRTTSIPLVAKNGRRLGAGIRQLLSINKDSILVATSFGLGVVNTKTLDFDGLFFESNEKGYFLEDNFVRWVIIGKEDTFWVFTKTAVHLLNSKLATIATVSLEKHPNITHAHLVSPICFPLSKFQLVINGLNFSRTNDRNLWFNINMKEETILPTTSILCEDIHIASNTQVTQDKSIVIGTPKPNGSQSFYYCNIKSNRCTLLMEYDDSEKVSIKRRQTSKKNESQYGLAFTRFKTGYFFDASSNTITEEYRNFRPYTRFLKMKNGVVYAANPEGLFRLNQQSNSFSVVSICDSLFNKNGFNDNVTDFLKKGKSIYIATHGKGLYRYDTLQKHIERIIVNGSRGSDMVWNIRLHNDSIIWIGTQNGLFIHNTVDKKDLRWKHDDLPYAIQHSPITTQFTDSKGILWIGLGFGNGVVAYDLKADTLKHYLYDKNKFPLRGVLGITEDHSGNLWMGYSSGGGLIRWDRQTDSFKKIEIDKNSGINSDLIYDLLVDHRDNIWIGTRLGLFVYSIKKNSFEEISKDSGLGNIFVNKLYQDTNKNIWMATTAGISILEYETRRIWSFSQKDGLPGAEAERIKAWNKTKDTLFIGATNGFCLVNINTILPKERKLKFYVEPLHIGKEIFDANAYDVIKLNYQQNNITVNFGVINHAEGGMNRYFYKLDKINDAWVELKSKGELLLLGLGANSYKLQLKVCVNGSNYIEAKPIYFIIKPPFWKSIWFFLMLIFSALALTIVFYRVKIFNMKRMEKMRMQISSDLHDDVGASISSVRILTDFLSGDEEEKGAKMTIIESIKEQSEYISEVLEEIVWNINPKNDKLGNIINRMQQYTNETLENAGIILEWQVSIHQYDKLIKADKRKELYLFFKEALNNIIKHAKCKQVWITIKSDSRHIYFMIKDDGIGYEINKEYKTNGLITMKGRAHKLHAKLIINSTLNKGTTIVLEFSY